MVGVHGVEIFAPLIDMDMVGAPAVALDQKAVAAANGIVVQPRMGVGEPLPGAPADLVSVDDNTAGIAPGDVGIGIFRVGGAARVHLGPVHPHAMKRAVVAKQGLDPGATEIGISLFGCAGEELFDDRRVLVLTPTGISEQFPADRNRIGRPAGVDQVGQGLARADVEEFIRVRADDPIGRLVAFMPGGQPQRGPLGRQHGPLAADSAVVVVDMGGKAQLLQAEGDGVGAVGAVVGVNQEIIIADGAVIRDPFQHERRLVLHRRDDEKAFLFLS